jgi:hypothetical protein
MGPAFGHFNHVQYDAACTHALLGRSEAALDRLRSAARSGSPCLALFARDPLLDPLRTQEGFQRLMAGLEPECAGYGRLYHELQRAAAVESAVDRSS